MGIPHLPLSNCGHEGGKVPQIRKKLARSHHWITVLVVNVVNLTRSNSNKLGMGFTTVYSTEPPNSSHESLQPFCTISLVGGLCCHGRSTQCRDNE